MYREMDVLLVLDGGCSPGYNAVTASLVEELEKRGRRVAVAATGFKSLVANEVEYIFCALQPVDSKKELGLQNSRA